MRRLALALPAALLAALASLAPVAPAVPACAAAGSNHAGLVVEHGDGSVVALCVAFSGDSISGEELLNLSGIAWSGRTFGGFGDAVCSLDREPAHYVDCPGKDSYWAVFVARGGGSWQLSGVGISNLALGDGDAEGFRYVPASGAPAAPASTTRVCPVATTTATTAAAAPTTGASATPAAGTPAIAGSPPAATAGATAGTTAGATAGATAGTTAGATAAGPGTTPPQGSTTPPSGGVEPGLVLAAVMGGGLAGLAILRLVAARRRGP